jgi:CBS domain-containing protein
MRLLDGRRVQLTDLIDAGLLEVGSALAFSRPRAGLTHRAEVTEEGRLRLEDGREFAAPSRAAAEAAELRSIDGWLVWVVESTSRTLAQLRHQLLSEAVQASVGETDRTAAHLSVESRHEALESAYEHAGTEAPRTFTVRDLIGLWGAKVRGYRVVDRVLADLENYSLTTRPDFRKVGLDSIVELVALPSAVSEEADGTDEVPTAEPEEREIGLTLGNVPSALAGLVVVNTNDSLAKAMTLMRLHDYSQLAILPTPRKLIGAVTWRSIAKALASDEDAKVGDAIEPAALFPFDTDLIDVLRVLYDRDFVFVTNGVAEVSGIVTASDVVRLYGDTATPFFLIGEIDHLLRRAVADEWTIEQVIEVCDPDGDRDLPSHDDLTIGDYQRMLESPDRFGALGWPLDRATFIKGLDEVREIRNAVAHFDPDPIDPAEVGTLQNFLYLLRELQSQP